MDKEKKYQIGGIVNTDYNPNTPTQYEAVLHKSIETIDGVKYMLLRDDDGNIVTKVTMPPEPICNDIGVLEFMEQELRHVAKRLSAK